MYGARKVLAIFPQPVHMTEFPSTESYGFDLENDITFGNIRAEIMLLSQGRKQKQFQADRIMI